jgi:hypothetical protein
LLDDGLAFIEGASQVQLLAFVDELLKQNTVAGQRLQLQILHTNLCELVGEGVQDEKAEEEKAEVKPAKEVVKDGGEMASFRFDSESATSANGSKAAGAAMCN